MRCSILVAGPSILLGATLGLLIPSGVHAQTEGRFSIGPQLTWHIPTANDIDSSVGFGVTYSLTRPKNHAAGAHGHSGSRARLDRRSDQPEAGLFRRNFLSPH